MGAWRPTCIVFILTLSSFLGVFAMYGTDVATGTIVGGHIAIDTTWDLNGSPYIVMENVIVDPGITLTIEPGVQVRFDPPGLHDYLHIYVEGTLISIGEANMSIEFTSDSPLPQVYDWESIQINSSGHIEMSYSRIAYSNIGIKILSSNNILANSFMTNNGLGVSLDVSSSENYIANNTVYNVGSFLYSDSSFRNTIENNTVWNCDQCVSLYDSTHNLLDGNVIRNSSYAIQIQWTSGNNTIVNNSIENATSYGIYLGQNTNGTVESNTVHECGVGIQLAGSPDNTNLTLANNTISHCSTGIKVGPSGGYNRLFGNRVVENEKGIYVGFNVKFDSFSVVSQNNVVSNSVYGILLENVSETLVYHNNFIDNSVQGLEDNGTNSWDNGYPSGGNYWSDYSGNDSFQGPNQIIPGSDGIGDTVYFIVTNGIDRYPLTEPTAGDLPPRNVNAYLTGKNFENVTITWNLSWNDGQRANDTTGYEIYRSSTYDKQRNGYSLVASTPNRTTEFLDSYAGEGNLSNYFYYVCAINGTGKYSCSQNQVGKFTRPLSNGPNLVSVPLIQSNESIQTVLQTVSFDNAWFFDSTNQEWKSFMRAKPYSGSLGFVNHTMGFWVNVTVTSNLTLAGIVPVQASIPLSRGWNLVGYPSLVTRSIGEYLASVAWDAIEGFDSSSPPYFLRHPDQSDEMIPGTSIWVCVTSETTLWVSDDM